MILFFLMNKSTNKSNVHMLTVDIHVYLMCFNSMHIISRCWYCFMLKLALSCYHFICLSFHSLFYLFMSYGIVCGKVIINLKATFVSVWFTDNCISIKLHKILMLLSMVWYSCVIWQFAINNINLARWRLDIVWWANPQISRCCW